MKIPPKKRCLALIEKFGMPEHIKGHTETVRRIANFIARGAKKNGAEISLVLVDRAALMHDFMKMHCVENNCRHALEAEKVMVNEGFPEFGAVLREHGLEEVNFFTEKTLLESKIVWYADKRVNHASVVPLTERYRYLKGRYGSKSAEKMDEILSTEKNGFALEKKLLKLARVSEKLEGLHA